MKPERKRWLWTGAKLIAAAAILLFVGRQLLGDMQKLDLSEVELSPGWILASAVLYLVGLFPSAWYWRHLHQEFGYPLSFYVAMRAHYVGQVGKYVPGKALALAIRAGLAHPFGVPYGVSVITSFYEVLTSMAAGGMVAALIYVIDPPILSKRLEFVAGWPIDPQWAGLLLMGVCGIPLLPGVFNLIIARMTSRIQAIELYRLPPVRYGTLLIGLLTTGIGWWIQGLSLWAILQTILPEPPPLTLSWAAQCTAAIAFANVAGFVILVVPGGLGVREYLIALLLGSAGSRGFLTACAILLRLDWIIAESLFALILYCIQPAPSPGMSAAIPGGENRTS
jgi:uncharacterized membrane protein YbhN (UPF0104 family)